MLKVQRVVLLAIVLLAGCGEVTVFGHKMGEHSPPQAKSASTSTSAPSTSPTSTSPAAVTPAVQAVKAVTLVLTPQAAAKVANDSNFNADALLDAIKGELRLRKLLDDNDSRAHDTAEISIDDFSLRPLSNAIVFGYMVNAGALNGDLQIRDTAGNSQKSFRIEAESRVSIAANGENTNPMKGLYHRFAVLAADNLAGVRSSSDLGADQHYR